MTYIGNIWNAKVVESNGQNYIKNMEYNSDIQPNSCVNFGYTLANASEIPDSMTTCQSRVDKENGYTVDLQITSDWGSGFNGEIVITNQTDNPIENWELTFDSNFTITNSWAASIVNSIDGIYTLKGTYNKIIYPNASVNLGFSGAKNDEANISNILLTEVIIGNATPNIPDEPMTKVDSCLVIGTMGSSISS